MKFTATAGGVDIPDGTFPATLLRIEERENAESGFAQTTYLRWTFAVFHNEEGCELIVNSSTAFGPKAKARKWMEAITSRRFEVGEEVDPADLCPIDCQVYVKKDDKGFSRIEDVLAERKRPAATVKPVTGVTV